MQRRLPRCSIVLRIVVSYLTVAPVEPSGSFTGVVVPFNVGCMEAQLHAPLVVHIANARLYRLLTTDPPYPTQSQCSRVSMVFLSHGR